MSFSSWSKEFLHPLECPEHLALGHMQRAWSGLSPDNLAKHGLFAARIDGMQWLCGRDKDGDFVQHIRVDGYSFFHLCQHHEFPEGHEHMEPDEVLVCETCPLSVIRGGSHCQADMELGDPALFGAPGETNSPWDEWNVNGNHERMVYWINRAVAAQE